MGRTVINQTSFASGEISPSLYGRVDRDIYFNGAAKLRNVYVAPLGGVIRRPGTKYIENTTTNQKCRLLPFQYRSAWQGIAGCSIHNYERPSPTA